MTKLDSLNVSCIDEKGLNDELKKNTEVTTVQHKREATSQKSLIEKFLSTASDFNNCNFMFNKNMMVWVRSNKTYNSIRKERH